MISKYLDKKVFIEGQSTNLEKLNSIMNSEILVGGSDSDISTCFQATIPATPESNQDDACQLCGTPDSRARQLPASLRQHPPTHVGHSGIRTADTEEHCGREAEAAATTAAASAAATVGHDGQAPRVARTAEGERAIYASAAAT